MPAARKNERPKVSLAVPILAISGIGALVALAFSLPGAVVLWLGAVLAAWQMPVPVLTGKKDPNSGAPTPEGPGEENAQALWRAASRLRTSLIFPNEGWTPGAGIRIMWFAQVGVTLLALSLPAMVSPDIPIPQSAFPDADPTWNPGIEPWIMSVANAYATLQLTSAIGVLAQSKNPSDPMPAVTVKDIEHSERIRPAVYGALAVLALGTLVATTLVGKSDLGTSGLVPPLVTGFGVALSLAALWGRAMVRPGVHEAWTKRTEAAAQHQGWWPEVEAAFAKTGGPRLISRVEHGTITVDTLQVPPGRVPSALIAYLPKLKALPGAQDLRAIILARDLDANGQPIPGKPHPSRVEVVSWSDENPPQVASIETTATEAEYAFMAALTLAITEFGQGGAQNVSAGIEPKHLGAAPVDAPRGWRRLLPSAPTETGDPTPPPTKTSEQDEDEDEHEQDEEQKTSPVAVWALQVVGQPDALRWVRDTYGAMVQDRLQTWVLTNSRPESMAGRHPGPNRIYFGAIDDETLVWAEPAAMEKVISLTRLDIEWNRRHAESHVKFGSSTAAGSPPDPQFAVQASGDVQVRGGGTVSMEYQPFTNKQSVAITDVLNSKYETAMRTTMQGIPMFGAIGFPAKGGRPGERHQLAFAVVTSQQNPPLSPADVTPPSGNPDQVRREAVDSFGTPERPRGGRNRGNSTPPTTARSPEQWLLSWQVNRAFDQAKLPRPEIAWARALTPRNSRAGHLWQIRMRVGLETTEKALNLDLLRKAKAALTPAFGSVGWLEFASTDQGQAVIDMVIGTHYTEIDLVDETRDLPFLVNLEWEQAFAREGLVRDGSAPSLINSEPVPANPNVLDLTFQMPPGLTTDNVKSRLDSLRMGLGYEFIQIEPSKVGTLHLTVSRDDPMPLPAPVMLDAFDDMENLTSVPFATNARGEAVTIEVLQNPHLIALGASRSGKSSAAQMVLTSMVRKGMVVVIVDTQKAAADFQFLAPWAQAIATSMEQAKVVLDMTVAEMDRRKTINGQHGVPNYRELPEDVRYPHMMLFLDEFTSMMSVDVPRKPNPTADEQAWSEYEIALAKSDQVQSIGSKVARILREAGSAGISICLSGQTLKKETIESIPGGQSMKTNAARLLVGKANDGDRRSALRDPDGSPNVGEAPPQGRGVYEPVFGAPQIVQSWHTGDGGFTRYLGSLLTERVEPLSEDKRWNLTAVKDTGPRVVGAEVKDDEAAYVPDALDVLDADEEVEDLGLMDLGITLDSLVLDVEPEPEIVSEPEPEPEVVSEPEPEVAPEPEADEWGEDGPPTLVVATITQVPTEPGNGPMWWIGDDPAPQGARVSAGLVSPVPLLDAMSEVCEDEAVDEVRVLASDEYRDEAEEMAQAVGLSVRWDIPTETTEPDWAADAGPAPEPVQEAPALAQEPAEPDWATVDAPESSEPVQEAPAPVQEPAEPDWATVDAPEPSEPVQEAPAPAGTVTYGGWSDNGDDDWTG